MHAWPLEEVFLISAKDNISCTLYYSAGALERSSYSPKASAFLVLHLLSAMWYKSSSKTNSLNLFVVFDEMLLHVILSDPTESAQPACDIFIGQTTQTH